MSTDSLSAWGSATLAQFLPWHTAALASLTSQKASDRLSHAYLVSAQNGVGGLQFVYALAAGLLCRQPEGLIACGQCKSCALSCAGGHPDAYLLSPEDSKVIKIDQIRGVIKFANETAQQGGYRVILVCPAEAMNPNAANGLLKLLEEPGAKTVVILLSYAPAAIAATLRSRCQKLFLAPPSVDQAQQWWASRAVKLSDADQYYYASQPLLPLAAHEAGQPTDRAHVATVLNEFLSGALTAQVFAARIAKLPLLGAIDVLYGLCLERLKLQSPTITTQLAFTQLSALVDLRRQLLAGATINVELYLQSWAIAHIK